MTSLQNPQSRLFLLVLSVFSFTFYGSTNTTIDNSNVIYNTNASASASSITIVYPNGNEFWQTGKTPEITWESQDLTANIILEYSLDNGLTWLPIATVDKSLSSYTWTIPNTVSKASVVRATSGLVSDTSDSVFEISNDDSTCNIVVLGSSTAVGTGADPIENSFVNKFEYTISQENTKLNVINLAKSGYSTYQILPTGTAVPTGITVDSERNITKALTYNPVAVLINMPSNDTDYGYSVETQLNNYQIVVQEANDNGVAAWVTTTQPRDFGNAAKDQMQVEVKDGINNLFGSYAIDFWTDLVDVDGELKSNLTADGIHPNNLGHDLLYQKVMEKDIQNQVCSKTGATLAVEELKGIEDFGLKMYPNPTTDYVMFKFNAVTDGTLSISFYDVLGKKHLDMSSNHLFNAGTTTIPIHWYTKSTTMYFAVLEFTTPNGLFKKTLPLLIR